MVKKVLTELSESDVLFLVETAAPGLKGKADIIRNDPSIVDTMLEQETERLFQRVMLTGSDKTVTRISPRLLFEILLRKALKDMGNRNYTVERTASRKIPVFDAGEVVSFFADRAALKYLVDMLSSFTRTEGFTRRIRLRKGVWRKITYSDMDIDSLKRLCATVDEEYRFAFYKRIADLCLFIMGMFPEYAAAGLPNPFSRGARPSYFGNSSRLRSAEDYEEEGRRFYQLAGEHQNARLLEITGVLSRLHEKFNLATKPLSYISENFIKFQKGRIFPFLSAN
ncbi:MAG: hypothetical protein ABIB93_03930 [Chloroflexota bacterium]